MLNVSAFACPNCKRPVAVPNESLGRAMICAQCGGTFRTAVPAQAVLQPDDPELPASGGELPASAGESDPLAGTAPARRRKRGLGVREACILGGSLGLALLLLLIGLVAVPRLIARTTSITSPVAAVPPKSPVPTSLPPGAVAPPVAPSLAPAIPPAAALPVAAAAGQTASPGVAWPAPPPVAAPRPTIHTPAVANHLSRPARSLSDRSRRTLPDKDSDGRWLLMLPDVEEDDEAASRLEQPAPNTLDAAAAAELQAVVALWDASEKQGDLRVALGHAQQAVSQAEVVYGSRAAATLHLHGRLGTTLLGCGEYKRAQQALVAAIKKGVASPAMETSQSISPVDLAALVLRLAEIQFEFREYNNAEQLLLWLRQTLEQHAPRDPVMAETLALQSRWQRLRGQVAKAAATADQAIDLSRPLGPTNLVFARAVFAAGYAATGGNDLAEAATHLQFAMRTLERALAKDHPETVLAQFYYATVLEAQGNQIEAQRLYEDCRRRWEAKLGPQHLWVSFAVNSLGNIAVSQRNHTLARKHYEASLAIRERAVGKLHREYALGLGNSARLQIEMGDYSQAAKTIQSAVHLLEVKYGPEDFDLVGPLTDMGRLAARGRDLAQPLTFTQRALAIVEKISGKDDIRTFYPRNNLAHLLDDSGSHDEAERLLNLNLQVAEKARGEHGAETAQALQSLATFAASRRNLAPAIEHQERALEILEHCHGANHPEVGRHAAILAKYLGLAGRWADAQAAAERSRRVSHRYATGELAALSEAEQVRFMRSQDHWQQALVLTLGARGEAHPPLAEASANWLLNSKALLFDVLTYTARQSQASADPAVVSIRAQLQDLRQNLAAMVAAPRTDTSLQSILDLQEDQERLVRDLGEKIGARQTPWLQISAMRQKLGPKQILVDVARIRPWGTEAERYYAWIIPPASAPEEKIEIIDLGDARELDAHVYAARRGLVISSMYVPLIGEGRGEELAKRVLQPLSDEIIARLYPRLGRYEEWLISPDAHLWLAPWPALLLDKGRYVVERHAVRLLTSSRDLAVEHAPRSNKPGVIFANPDYNLGVPATFEGPMGPLPGAEAEAKAVKVRLKRMVGAEPEILLGKAATIAALERTVSPRVLLLSTHGYFQPLPEILEINPLLNCGLAFAGANRAFFRQTLPDDAGAQRPAPGPPTVRPPLGAASQPSLNPNAPNVEDPNVPQGQDRVLPPLVQVEGDDGIATGMEILGLDLRGTQLVVLSACETGKGQVVGGEGVIGICRAFQLAGAECVVSTLWPIPDDTADLMGSFFNALAGGQSEAVAMRTAMRATITIRRSKYRGAHPVVWAGFTVTGGSQPAAEMKPPAD